MSRKSNKPCFQFKMDLKKCYLKENLRIPPIWQFQHGMDIDDLLKKEPNGREIIYKPNNTKNHESD